MRTQLKHDFQAVTGAPLQFVCYGCSKRMSMTHETVWADLKGPAFKAYYCEGCKRSAEQWDQAAKDA